MRAVYTRVTYRSRTCTVVTRVGGWARVCCGLSLNVQLSCSNTSSVPVRAQVGETKSRVLLRPARIPSNSAKRVDTRGKVDPPAAESGATRKNRVLHVRRP